MVDVRTYQRQLQQRRASLSQARAKVESQDIEYTRKQLQDMPREQRQMEESRFQREKAEALRKIEQEFQTQEKLEREFEPVKKAEQYRTEYQRGFRKAGTKFGALGLSTEAELAGYEAGSGQLKSIESIKKFKQDIKKFEEQYPTEKVIYDPKTFEIKGIQSGELGMSIAVPEYLKQTQPVQPQINFEKLSTPNTNILSPIRDIPSIDTKTITRKQIDTYKGTPVYQYYTKEAGKTRKATDEEVKYYREQTGMLDVQRGVGAIESPMIRKAGATVQKIFTEPKWFSKVTEGIEKKPSLYKGKVYKQEELPKSISFGGKSIFDVSTDIIFKGGEKVYKSIEKKIPEGVIKRSLSTEVPTGTAKAFLGTMLLGTATARLFKTGAASKQVKKQLQESRFSSLEKDLKGKEFFEELERQLKEKKSPAEQKKLLKDIEKHYGLTEENVKKLEKYLKERDVLKETKVTIKIEDGKVVTEIESPQKVDFVIFEKPPKIKGTGETVGVVGGLKEGRFDVLGMKQKTIDVQKEKQLQGQRFKPLQAGGLKEGRFDVLGMKQKTIDVQKEKQLQGQRFKPLQALMMKSKVIQKERQAQKVIMKQLQKQRERQAQKVIMKQPQKQRERQVVQSIVQFIQKQEQKVKVRQEVTQIEKQVSKERRIPKPKKPITFIPKPEPQKSIKQLKRKAKDVLKEFEVFTRTRGKDIKIGEFETEFQARKALKGELSETLRASGFVLKEGKKQKINLGMDFRPSKIDPLRVVQKRGKRLFSIPERREIQLFRRRKIL